MKKIVLYAVAATSIVSVGAMAEEAARNITSGTVEQRLEALAAIQPGLGTVMMEYGNRFANIHFAAEAGNWGLAEYQLKEAREIQEVGEITRPARAKPLKEFEQTFLDPLEEAIKNEDLSLFKKRYAEAVAGCNDCHVLSRFPFIQFVVPEKPLETNLNYYAVKVKGAPEGSGN